MIIEIYQITGENCITQEDGEDVYNKIHPALLKGEEKVELDFNNVKVFASTFFNQSIGRLLEDIAPKTLNELLSFSNLSEIGDSVLRKVIDNAKRYYSDPNFKKAHDETMSERLNDV
ncbi:hypothetical protein MCHI_003143 [Candidatus Magnetoovum chiemensis]|nr:hypothetical protein MCHI_003143 [Candidatus Magnetoovum chiemensis]